MTELQILRWFENPEDTTCYEDFEGCSGCGCPEGECECIDDWKLED